VVSFIVFTIIERLADLRLSAEGEIVGLDLHEHGAAAYPEFALTGMDGTPKSLEEAKKAKGGAVASPAAAAGD
jgi:hypothetical protein